MYFCSDLPRRISDVNLNHDHTHDTYFLHLIDIIEFENDENKQCAFHRVIFHWFNF